MKHNTDRQPPPLNAVHEGKDTNEHDMEATLFPVRIRGIPAWYEPKTIFKVSVPRGSDASLTHSLTLVL